VSNELVRPRSRIVEHRRRFDRRELIRQTPESVPELGVPRLLLFRGEVALENAELFEA
jgi:hypothetical protein